MLASRLRHAERVPRSNPVLRSQQTCLRAQAESPGEPKYAGTTPGAAALPGQTPSAREPTERSEAEVRDRAESRAQRETQDPTKTGNAKNGQMRRGNRLRPGRKAETRATTVHGEGRGCEGRAPLPVPQRHRSLTSSQAASPAPHGKPRSAGRAGKDSGNRDTPGAASALGVTEAGRQPPSPAGALSGLFNSSQAISQPSTSTASTTLTPAQ